MAAAAHAKPNHDYHLVNPSPWPFVGSVSAFVMAIGAIWFFKTRTTDSPQPWLIFIGFAGVLYTMYAWWADVVKEVDHRRPHPGGEDASPLRHDPVHRLRSDVLRRLVLGLFRRLLPPRRRRAVCPRRLRWAATGRRTGVELFDPFHLPLFNTLILLTSGTTVTWAHHALLHNDKQRPQGRASGADHRPGRAVHLRAGPRILACRLSAATGNIYGATFFMATGFHGFHVLIGTIFLTVCLIRA